MTTKSATTQPFLSETAEDNPTTEAEIDSFTRNSVLADEEPKTNASSESPGAACSRSSIAASDSRSTRLR